MHVILSQGFINNFTPKLTS